MLYNAQTASAITVGAWWEVFAPCIAIAVIGIGLSLVNFGVDEISNPRIRTLSALRRVVRPAAPNGRRTRELEGA